MPDLFLKEGMIAIMKKFVIPIIISVIIIGLILYFFIFNNNSQTPSPNATRMSTDMR